MEFQRNIVKEIMRECSPKKLKPNENFLTYFVNLLLLDPSWGITKNMMTSRNNIQNFIKCVIKELEDGRSMKMITLKMQFTYECHMENTNNYINDYRQRLMDRLAPLKNDICNSTTLNDNNDINLLYKKITYYIVLLSGMGKPTLEHVYIEALVALKSIMDDHELKEFVQLPKEQKTDELVHLSKLVCGIRLFNKDCNKGGVGIPNVPLHVKKAVSVIRDQLHSDLYKVMETVNPVTTFLDKSCVLIKDYENKALLEVQLPESMEHQVFYEAKHVLVLFRQYELYIRKLLDKLIELEHKATELFSQFEKTLKRIHKTVHLKIAISVALVFPLFESLANLWTTLQNQIIILFIYQKVMAYLKEYSTTNAESKRSWKFMSRMVLVQTDSERMEDRADLLVSNNPQIIVHKPEMYGNVTIQFLGFCPFKLIKSEGGLMPGCHNMGVVEYKTMFYTFSCEEGFKEFCDDPDLMIRQVLDLARKKPHLINFLGLKNQLIRVLNIIELVEKPKVVKKLQNQKVQTLSSHCEIITPYKDPKYKWNVWDLKREALLMANISKCTTKSTQTEKSFSTNVALTQTYTLHNREIQTKFDKNTNVPKPSMFIYGLRGRKDDKQFKFDLTLPVDK